MSDLPIRDSLPRNFTLLWYTINNVLGRGGFGITYLAKDTNLDHLVAIKEYLPVDHAGRVENDSTVRPLTSSHEEIYNWGLKNFIKEAQTLAKFQHPNLVHVLSVFNRLNTAYMVMEYEKGIELSKLIKNREAFSEQSLIRMFAPLIDGLNAIHQAGFIHRDIKPSNILIRTDGSPVLLDFGSARLAEGELTHTLTSMVTFGYAPFEQYNQSGEKQGPWTDIYALAATLYHMITGIRPIDSMKRAIALMNGDRDPLEPLQIKAKGDYPDYLLAAIDIGLSSQINDRPQTVIEWREMLLGKVTSYKTVVMNLKSPKSTLVDTHTLNKKTATKSNMHETNLSKGQNKNKKSVRFKKALSSASLFTALLLILGFYFAGMWPSSISEIAWLDFTQSALQKTVSLANDADKRVEQKPESIIHIDKLPPPALTLYSKDSVREKEPTALNQKTKSRKITHKKIPSEKKTTIKLDKPKVTPPINESITKHETPVLPRAQSITKIQTPSLASKASKLIIIENKPDNQQISQENVSEQTSILLEKFVFAFKVMDKTSLLAFTNLSAQKTKLVDVIFKEYQAGKLDVISLQTYTKTNTAHAKLTIRDLLNRDGNLVTPGGWKNIQFKIKADQLGVMKIYWE